LHIPKEDNYELISLYILLLSKTSKNLKQSCPKSKNDPISKTIKKFEVFLRLDMLLNTQSSLVIIVLLENCHCISFSIETEVFQVAFQLTSVSIYREVYNHPEINKNLENKTNKRRHTNGSSVVNAFS
jgi:hypothetical protein